MNSENNFFKNKYDFTIVTIVKNDQKNIETTIKSVLAQTNKKIQYIVLDGCSSDNTFKIISKYKSKIKLIKFRDKNFYDGLNHAIKFSKGKYFGILNSGDIYYDNKVLTKVKENFKNVDYIFGNILFYNQNKKINRVWEILFKKRKYFFYYIAHPSVFIKSEIIRKKKFMYNINYKISSDTDFLIKLNIQKNLKYKHLNNYLVFMKQGGLSTSYKYLITKIKEDLTVLQKYFPKNYLLIYVKKIFIKFNGLIKITNKLYNEKKLQKQINFLNNINE